MKHVEGQEDENMSRWAIFLGRKPIVDDGRADDLRKGSLNFEQCRKTMEHPPNSPTKRAPCFYQDHSASRIECVPKNSIYHGLPLSLLSGVRLGVGVRGWVRVSWVRVRVSVSKKEGRT